MTRLVIVIALLAALGGCKKKDPGVPTVDFRDDWTTLIDLRDGMCRCTDRTCAEEALARFTTWSTTGARRVYTPTTTQTMDMDRLKQELNTCMVKAMVKREKVAQPAPPPPPSKPTTPAIPKAPITVDQLIAAAREFATGENAQLVIASIDATYVDSEGTLDAEDGSLLIALGAAAPTDDPKRRVGAPVKPRPAPPSECSKLTFTHAKGWATEAFGCIEARRPFPRCAITEIWKRAIAKAAPIDAVAVVQLREETPRRWTFTIVDEPRKINIQHFLPDDCELPLEKQ